MKQFNNFYEGAYAKYILPGVLLQSVLIGGGYATGREIYSYGAKFGAMGWISGLTIGIGFALFAFLTFEICRIYKVYDYKNYIKQVIGPLWPCLLYTSNQSHIQKMMPQCTFSANCPNGCSFSYW